MSDVHDLLFEALANEQRRRILFGLLERDSPAETTIDIDTPPDTTTGGETTALEQYHVHLPKLDAFEFVDWNPRANTVKPGGRFTEIRPVLQLLHDNRERFPPSGV